MNGCKLRFDLAGVHAEVATLPAPCVKKRSRSAAHTFAATVLAPALASISTARRGSAAALLRALHADLFRDVENNGQIGLEIADGYPLHRIQNRRRDLPQAALIGTRRIRKAVTQHPYSLIERRLDDGAAMVVARGCKQQRLRIGA